MRLHTATGLGLVLTALPATALGAPLIIDGADPTNTACPGGTETNGGATCVYGGVHEFDYVDIRNGGALEVVVFDGADQLNTGNLVVRALGRDPTGAFSIRLDAQSRITAKGSGYRGVSCDDGAGPALFPLAGGRGGCSVRDSGGGGAHFGRGGKGTKDCFIVAPDDSCTFPQEWEEACGGPDAWDASGDATSCGDIADDPDTGLDCYGSSPQWATNGQGDSLPDVAGRAFWHHILAPEFGAAGGDKGCRDGNGYGAANLRAGEGGGRIVLVAATGAEDGLLLIDGRVIADGTRGCSLGNDSAGGGAGGSILLLGDHVQVGPTARVSAHGGRGGDSQPKCLPCATPGTGDGCQAGQICTEYTEPASGNVYALCGPCNCTPCSDATDCTFPGQTCVALGGDLGNVCVDASGACTPFDVGDDERECTGAQNSGTCDDCAGGGGGGIISVQSRTSNLDPEAIFDVRGALGGICPICAGEAGGGAGELQLDGGYSGELCDGWDNDFDGQVDEGLPELDCPDGPAPACVGGVPQDCTYDRAECLVPADDSSPRFALILDSSGSMLNDVAGYPTFGDGSVGHLGVDTGADPEADAGDDSRLFIAKRAMARVLAAFPENGYALARYFQDVGDARSCQTASNFECAMSCCSYDDPTDNVAPTYPDWYPGNRCVMSALYPGAGYAAATFPNPGRTDDIEIGWSSPEANCINYAGSCGPPRRGAQYLVGFERPITQYLDWLDGAETDFLADVTEGDHCLGGDCELRATGPTPLAGALEATASFLSPVVTCDGARDCRSYAAILLTDGAESCQGDPVAAAAALRVAVPEKEIKTYVIGFSVQDSERAELNAIAVAGGTDAAAFTGGADAAFFATDEDELANAVATIVASSQVFEQCNELDDDCDELVDEDFPDKGVICDDGELGLCRGTGTRQCRADGTGTECVIDDPGADPTTEVCNGLDDDCDGLVDEGLTCTGCVPDLELCDGVDNDCDGAVDEEPDVSTNDERIGVACEEPIPPNDQPPCEGGETRCVNGRPFCVGAVGPRDEICNGLDDDCDGEADTFAACPSEGSACIEGRCAEPCGGGEFPCPGGYDCVAGFCLPSGCEGVTCEPGRVCVNGLCIDEPGGTAGAGGAGGAGGAAPAPGAAGTSPETGGTTATGGSDPEEPNPDAIYGQATGGGGCGCRVEPRGLGPFGWVSSFAVALALALRRRRTGAVQRAGGAA